MMTTTILECVTVFVVLCAAITVSTADTINLGYKPARPSFAGATGGDWVNYAGQRVPLGKPWPARPEDYPSFSVTTGKTTLKNDLQEATTEDYSNITTETFGTTTQTDSNDISQGIFQEETKTEGSAISTTIDEVEKSTTSSSDITVTWGEVETTNIPKLPFPNRPPFLGPTGGNFIPPGKPWPARPEDYERNNMTSQQSTSKETTTASFVENITKEVEVNVPTRLPVPNRPTFLGPTGGNFIPQSIPPGKPWPARPEDYESFNVMSQRPNVESTSLLNKETILNVSAVNPPPLEVSKPSRPLTEKPQADKIIFPNDPLLNNKTSLESESDKSNVFSVAFYFGAGNSKGESEDVKPSLSISVNLEALKGAKTDTQTSMVNAIDQSLASEKQSDGNYSVWVDLKDIISSKISSAKINISHPAKKTEDNEKGINEQVNVIDTKSKSTKNPLMSVFFNFADFRDIGKYSTKPGEDGKYFTIHRGRR